MKRTSERANARDAAGVGGGDHGHPQPAARRVRCCTHKSFISSEPRYFIQAKMSLRLLCALLYEIGMAT